MTASYFVAGSNHRLWTSAVRERLFAEVAEVPSLLGRLRAAGLEQAVWLATCDRVEVLGLHPDPEGAAATVAAILAERAGLPVAATAVGDVAAMLAEPNRRFATACDDEALAAAPHRPAGRSGAARHAGRGEPRPRGRRIRSGTDVPQLRHAAGGLELCAAQPTAV